MKKVILGFALVAASLVCAQRSEIHFGIKAGLNVARMGNTNLLDESSRNSIHAGIFGNFKFAEKFSFQPEVLYSAYGEREKLFNTYQEDGYTTKVTSNFRIKLDYITIPLMFQYNIIPNLYVEAGPEVGILLSERIRGTVDGTITSENSSQAFVEDFKSPVDRNNFHGVNLGVGIGAGYYFNDKIGINARYVAGLSDVLRHNPLHYSDAIRNNVFQVGVMYKF